MSQAKRTKSENGGVTHTLKVSVPDSWQVIPLEEVLEDIVGGGTPSRDNPSYWSGPIPWLTVKDMRTRRPADSIDHISEEAVNDSATNIIPADTVIIATRIGLGKVIRVPYDAAINQDLKALITKPIVDKSYLEYWIYSIASYLESIGSGTTVKGIRLEHVRSLPFPLAPLDQQKRIVAEIEKQFSRLDEAVANLKRVKANLKRYKAAVLNEAVAGLPVQTLGTLLREPLRNGHSAKATSDPHGLRAFTLTAVTEGDFSEVNTKRTVADPMKVADLWAEPGDIYIERSNTPELVGTARLYRGPKNFAFIPDLLIRVRLSSAVLPEYAEIALQSDHARRYFRGKAQGIAGSMPKIDQTTVERFPFPLPELRVQHRIIAEIDRRLSILRGTETQVDANLQRAERLRQTILESAFSGKLNENGRRHTESGAKYGLG